MRNYISKKKLSASCEDYLESIYHLAASGKAARSKDIASDLSVSRASVSGALKLLSKKGLIDYQPYGYVCLTEAGVKEAQSVVKRHKIIEKFFTDVLGVDAPSAESAACRAEHALGKAVIPKMKILTDFFAQSGKAEDFQKFCRTRGL